MTPDSPTPADLARQIRATKARLGDKVDQAVFDAEMKHLYLDITEIKESQRYATRLLVTQLVVFFIAIIIFVVTQGL